MQLAGGQDRLKAHPEFGSSVNPITTREADYAHCITSCPPGFKSLAASLSLVMSLRRAEGFSVQLGLARLGS